MMNKFKILIVEDEAAYLDLVSSELTRKGYKVTKAVDGKDGLDKANKENFDLILLDLHMPKMDGITMLDSLQKYKRLKKPKVIILTNIEPDDKILEAVIRDQPFYYFIKSDIQLNDLMTKITKLFAE